MGKPRAFAFNSALVRKNLMPLSQIICIRKWVRSLMVFHDLWESIGDATCPEMGGNPSQCTMPPKTPVASYIFNTPLVRRETESVMGTLFFFRLRNKEKFRYMQFACVPRSKRCLLSSQMILVCFLFFFCVLLVYLSLQKTICICQKHSHNGEKKATTHSPQQSNKTKQKCGILCGAWHAKHVPPISVLLLRLTYKSFCRVPNVEWGAIMQLE